VKCVDRKKLKDFIFVDEALIDKYIEQIRHTFTEVDMKSWKLSASITGPSIERSTKQERIPLRLHEKIELIEAALESQEDLLTSRPEKIIRGSQQARFVRETMLATKVMLPLGDASPARELSSAALWISDPDPTLYVREPYDWRGTFLYLSELHWDVSLKYPFLSGVSALQAIVNLSRGLDFFHVITDEFEPFGRGRDLHPIDKLKEIGGIAVDKRKITSLYQVRYFMNEQTYRYEGEKRRVNDLLGYPFYIVSEQ